MIAVLVCLIFVVPYHFLLLLVFVVLLPFLWLPFLQVYLQGYLIKLLILLVLNRTFDGGGGGGGSPPVAAGSATGLGERMYYFPYRPVV